MLLSSRGLHKIFVLSILSFCFVLVLFRHPLQGWTYRPLIPSGHPSGASDDRHDHEALMTALDASGSAGQGDGVQPTSSSPYHAKSTVASVTPIATAGSIQPTPAVEETTLSDEEYIAKVIVWDRPVDDGKHWPSYFAYKNKDYDPNRWEGFELENGYYTGGAISSASEGAPPRTSLSEVYPDYNGEQWHEQWRGEYVACEGPRGLLLNESSEEYALGFRGVPDGFPKTSVGSYEAIGMNGDSCYDGFSRYGPYGFGAGEEKSPVDWDAVNWKTLQAECLARNAERYRPGASEVSNVPSILGPSSPYFDFENPESRWDLDTQCHSRTAILIRSWAGYEYSDNLIQSIRAMITELSLLSGGEYQVFLLVQIRDKKASLSDQASRDALVKRHVPRELRDIAVLWNEASCKEWYPDVGDWQVYWHQWMPVQLFLKAHPGFDYVWNWEVDARYTGNHYQFLSAVSEFARAQPRKYLWERNKRFYLPSVHGDNFTAFQESTNEIVASAAAQGGTEPPVWGPQPYPPTQAPVGPTPPHSIDHDAFTWGVGEEADFITLLPIWDPRNTSWEMKDKIWNFVPGIRPSFSPTNPIASGFTHANFSQIPRRAYINTVVRLSRELLNAMHAENLAGRSMQAEMWPATVALQHGLKAVYAPHPIWLNVKWPGRYLDLVVNAERENGTATWSEGPTSVYNHDREWNFAGWSWYYHSKFPRVLYRRWLGFKVDGGLEKDQDDSADRDGGIKRRVCLPPMMLHPVKRMGEGEV